MTEYYDDEEIEIFDPETGALDFDLAMRLYKENPEKLERIQQKAVQELIGSASEEQQRRLNGLQFKIDSQRRLAKNPMQSYINLSRMFWTEGVQKLQDALNGDYVPPKPKGSGDNVINADFRNPESTP